MDNETYKKYLKNLNYKKESVIREIECQSSGSSENILPALFFKNIYDLTNEQVLLLDIMIDMYRIGRGVKL